MTRSSVHSSAAAASDTTGVEVLLPGSQIRPAAFILSLGFPSRWNPRKSTDLTNLESIQFTEKLLLFLIMTATGASLFMAHTTRGGSEDPEITEFKASASTRCVVLEATITAICG